MLVPEVGQEGGMRSLKGWPLQGQSVLRDLGRTLGVACDRVESVPGALRSPGENCSPPTGSLSGRLGALSAGGFRVENALGSPPCPRSC